MRMMLNGAVRSWTQCCRENSVKLRKPSDEPLQVRVGIASGVVVLDTTIGARPLRVLIRTWRNAELGCLIAEFGSLV